MSALAIVAICVGGTFAYCGLATYLYMRLIWHMRQRDRYAMEEGAFFAAVLMPIGLCLLVAYSLNTVDKQGLAPRSVRRERRIKEQEAEIARLEKELGIR